jgi:hypothetical protein
MMMVMPTVIMLKSCRTSIKGTMDVSIRTHLTIKRRIKHPATTMMMSCSIPLMKSTMKNLNVDWTMLHVSLSI